MRPRKQAPWGSEDLFRHRLDNILDLRHELCCLAKLIDWEAFDTAFGRFYRERGWPGKPTRLMVGLS